MVLIERAYEIAKNHNYDGYQRKLKSMVYNFFDEKPGSGISVNEQVAKEVHKPVTKKIKRGKFYARFKNNIWIRCYLLKFFISTIKNFNK